MITEGIPGEAKNSTGRVTIFYFYIHEIELNIQSRLSCLFYSGNKKACYNLLKMKIFLDEKRSGMLFFGPGIRYVPDNVWQSKFFWAALVLMIAGSIIYKNIFSGMAQKNSPFGRLFRFLTGDDGSKMPKILYSSEGRSGRVHYKSAEADFDLYYEFGGGDCIVCIDVPDPKDWQQHTGLPTERREEILNFIGQQVVKDQTTGGRGYFKIEGNWLNIYV